MDLLHAINETLRNEESVALATLVSATGSSAKKVGAKMVVGRSGQILGGVTIGGCVDAQVIEASDALLRESGAGRRTLLSISLDDDEAWEIGLTCGGTIEVLLESVDPSNPGDPVIAAHRRAEEIVASGETAAVLRPIESAESPVTMRESELESAAVAGRTFVDRIAPSASLLIIGAGEVAMSLTRCARELGMRTIIVDGRDRYATRERFPDADEIHLGMPSEIVANVPFNKHVAVILVAHDYKYELPVLRQVLRAPVGYIGMLGSKKRGAAVREMLRDEGFSDAELERIHTPVGLDLGGKSSPEVAVSIIAEIIAVRNGRRA